jgi:hypothetical protein
MVAAVAASAAAGFCRIVRIVCAPPCNATLKNGTNSLTARDHSPARWKSTVASRNAIVCSRSDAPRRAARRAAAKRGICSIRPPIGSAPSVSA